MNPPVPPEPEPPEPEPPEPETHVYTYSGVTEIPIGSTTGMFYSAMKDGDDSCYLNVSVDGSPVSLARLIVNPVPAFDQINQYFCNAYMTVCVLASNATIGGTHPYYSYDSTNHEMVQAGTLDVISCTPSDYFDTIKSGDYVLEPRS